MIIASQLRAGMAIRIADQVFKVLECTVKAGGGQAGGTVKCKLQNVSSGRMWEPHFRPDERLENLEVERRTLEFLYSDDAGCTFMDPNSFEQVQVPRELVGSAEPFLQAGMSLPVEFFEGNAISVLLPDMVEARVVETAPPIHSGQDSTWKEAKLDNGLKVQVPLFIDRDEVVRIDVRSVRYVERVRLERKRGA